MLSFLCFPWLPAEPRSRTPPAVSSPSPTGSSASWRPVPRHRSLLYVLAPEKMIGWTAAPRPNEREFLLPSVRDLPAARPADRAGRHRQHRGRAQGQARPDLRLRLGEPDLCLAREPRAGPDRGALSAARRPARPHRRHRAPARQGARRARTGRPHRRLHRGDRAADRQPPARPAAGAAPPGLSRPRGERPRDRAHRLDQHRDHRARRRHQRRRARQPARRHRQCLDGTGDRLGARHHHHLGRQLLCGLRDEPAMGHGPGGGVKARLSRATAAVRLDRRAALDQPGDRAQMDRAAPLSRPVSRGHPRRRRGNSSSCSIRSSPTPPRSIAFLPGSSRAGAGADAQGRPGVPGADRRARRRDPGGARLWAVPAHRRTTSCGRRGGSPTGTMSGRDLGRDRVHAGAAAAGRGGDPGRRRAVGGRRDLPDAVPQSAGVAGHPGGLDRRRARRGAGHPDVDVGARHRGARLCRWRRDGAARLPHFLLAARP